LASVPPNPVQGTLHSRDRSPSRHASKSAAIDSEAHLIERRVETGRAA
jgi:hypothetical protein